MHDIVKQIDAKALEDLDVLLKKSPKDLKKRLVHWSGKYTERKLRLLALEIGHTEIDMEDISVLGKGVAKKVLVRMSRVIDLVLEGLFDIELDHSSPVLYRSILGRGNGKIL